MLPDLLHGSLDARARARVEAHVAICAECTDDLQVLRMVKSAAVFTPAIDVDRVVRQIAPYRAIVPAAEAPTRSRVVSWLVAASLVVVVLGGGSLLMIQPKPSGQRVASAARSPRTGATAPNKVARDGAAPVTPLATPASAIPAHSLAMASGVDGLSDNGLRQLMNDMDGFDALPTTEPEPVISVDSGDNPDMGSR